jgi:hypothetical protein
MIDCSSAHGRVARFLGVLFAASLLAGPMSSFAAHAQPAEPISAPSAAPQPSAEEAAKREAWRATIARTPAPKKGCFTASYPNAEWQEVPCGRPSPYPNPPRGPRPDAVGDANDYSAQVSGLISSAVGSFASVTPATISESGFWWGTTDCPPPPPRCPPAEPHCVQQNPGGDVNTCPVTTPNAFSLQLNSQFFSTALCQGHAVGNTPCQGWEQFVFSQDQCPDGPCMFIEYWLLNYGSTSPTTPPSSCATPWTPSGGVNWYCNSSPGQTPAISAAQLQETMLTAMAAGDGDTVVLTTAGAAAIAAPPAADSMLNLAQHWNAVEWNVFGDCCLFEANFSPGSTFAVKTSVNGGAVATCVQEGFTGETNNLSLVGTSAQDSTPPAIVFTQSNAAGGTPASCIVAVEGAPTPPGKGHGGPGPVCGRDGLPPCRKP